MPGGGRGTLTNIAVALNSEKHSEIADAIKMALGKAEYTISTSVLDIGAAFTNCEHTEDLADIWCFASEHNKIDWQEY